MEGNAGKGNGPTRGHWNTEYNGSLRNDFQMIRTSRTPTAPPFQLFQSVDLTLATTLHPLAEATEATSSTYMNYESSNLTSPIVGVSEPPPPSYLECTIPCPTSEEEVREILDYYGREDPCCFFRPNLQKIKIHDIQPKHTYRYVLQTFTETRVLKDASEPFRNQPIDGRMNGESPGKWNVPVAPPASFTSLSKKIELPHSASVRECNMCHGTAHTACIACCGLGFRPCGLCTGTGQIPRFGLVEYGACTECYGSGRHLCESCRIGRVRCYNCNGHMFMKHWKDLNISWAVKRQIFATPRGELSMEQLKKVREGGVVLEKTSEPDQALPLMFPRDPQINKVSKALLMKQIQSATQDRKVLELKQRVEVVPVVEVTFERKTKTGLFYIYGMEQKVFFPEDFRPGCCQIL